MGVLVTVMVSPKLADGCAVTKDAVGALVADGWMPPAEEGLRLSSAGKLPLNSVDDLPKSVFDMALPEGDVLDSSQVRKLLAPLLAEDDRSLKSKSPLEQAGFVHHVLSSANHGATLLILGRVHQESHCSPPGHPFDDILRRAPGPWPGLKVLYVIPAIRQVVFE